jgi:hypothetical protein
VTILLLFVAARSQRYFADRIAISNRYVTNDTQKLANQA